MLPVLHWLGTAYFDALLICFLCLYLRYYLWSFGVRWAIIEYFACRNIVIYVIALEYSSYNGRCCCQIATVRV